MFFYIVAKETSIILASFWKNLRPSKRRRSFCTGSFSIEHHRTTSQVDIPRLPVLSSDRDVHWMPNGVVTDKHDSSWSGVLSSIFDDSLFRGSRRTPPSHVFRDVNWTMPFFFGTNMQFSSPLWIKLVHRVDGGDSALYTPEH